MADKKRLMIFAHYYHPDVASTGQILKDLAEGMVNEFDVTVVCVVPSYDGKIEEKYKTQKYYSENINNVQVIRVRVPAFIKSNKISRIKNIVVYFFGALGATLKIGKQDYVLTVSQPPILGGVLGLCGKWLKHAKMIYCIQDFNPEQTMAMGYVNSKLITGMLLFLDKFSSKRSDLVITVGRDLVETLKLRFHNRNVPNHMMINNWIDEAKIYPLSEDNKKVIAFRNEYNLTGKFVIMYSGNIGLYYDLENLMKVIEKFKPGTRTANNKEVMFVFVGSGTILDKLVFYSKNNHMSNVIFIPYQDKENLIYSLNAADVHWCVNAKGIKGISCPSKYYGIASCAKPVLGVLESGSEIRTLIEKTKGGLIADPEDYVAIEKNIREFLNMSGSDELAQMGQRGYSYLVDNLTKATSIEKYIEAIKNL